MPLHLASSVIDEGELRYQFMFLVIGVHGIHGMEGDGGQVSDLI